MKYALFFVVFVSFQVQGQKFNTLSEGDKQQFQKEVQDEIQTFDSKLQKIANASSRRVQKALIKSLLRKFTTEATIQTASVKSGISTYKIKDYLYDKVPGYQKRYSVVDVEFVSLQIEDFKPHPSKPNWYIAKYNFVQRFCGVAKGAQRTTDEGLMNYSYCDLTEKEGSFVLKKAHTVLGAKWKLYFDSIAVEAIEIIEAKENDE
ncbi:hypothetical protein [Maribacter sp. 2307UL18-2]|uniref:hypothetical protein n=1 Tax=Maribacter sp. 2307UL18-2 TaxID=3386274 RepID=UPI0039BD5312